MAQDIISSVRGFRDIYANDAALYSFIEGKLHKISKSFGYDLIKLPILEKTELFVRSVGGGTDIVEKEMYTFDDKDKSSLTLRPEGTAVCLRAGIENGLLHNSIKRFRYCGPMFRHERPQQGRYRQFYQFGLELVGQNSPKSDVEIIVLSANILKELGLLDKVVLEVNTLASKGARDRYKDKLVDYFNNNIDSLDEDSKRRLGKNPLRILDSKNPDMSALIEKAPKLLDNLDDDSKAHFDTVLSILDSLNIKYSINKNLVRGIDYYTHTVFEWVSKDLGAQATICAGGRYDGLVEQIGGKPNFSVGLAFGVDRLAHLYEKFYGSKDTHIDIYFINTDNASYVRAQQLSNALREKNNKLKIVVNADNSSFKSQFKRADKIGANFALVLGESELENNTLTVKDLRGGGTQKEVSQDKLDTILDLFSA